jgi:hypothetical protein
METQTDSSTGAIIKSDRTGRNRYTAQYKREVLDAFESSSLSAPAFAMQCGVKYPTFAAWIAGRRRGSLPGPARQRSDAPAFLRGRESRELSGISVPWSRAQFSRFPTSIPKDAGSPAP